MAQISEKSTENIWTDLYSVTLSANDKNMGTKKCLTLKQLERDGEEPFILAEIRAFLNGKRTNVGVCMTPYEFDWFAKKLIALNDDKQELRSKSSPRILTLKRKPNKKGVEVNQQVDDKMRRINLFKKEIAIIIEKYPTFYDIIEEMQNDGISDED